MSTPETRANTDMYIDLFRKLIREVPGKKCPIAYVMSETIDNSEAPLIASAKLLKEGFVEKIAITDPLPPYTYGYPGPDYYKQILNKNGVSDEQILVISRETHEPNMNTQTELTALAKQIKDMNAIIIVAPWFHVLRSYITAVSEFKAEKLNTKIFVQSVPFKASETINHSQGIQRGTRREISMQELNKCQQYPNLVSIHEALDVFYKHRSTN